MMAPSREETFSSITLIKRHLCFSLETETMATLQWDGSVKLQRNPGSVLVGGNVVSVCQSKFS